MAKILNQSSWPRPNKAIEAALGRFIIAWNILEQQMDFAIEEMSGLENDLAMCVTANLGTKAKIEIYQSLAHCMSEIIGHNTLAEIDKLAGDTSNASGELRNFIVHGQPFLVRTIKGDREVWGKWAARKGGVRGKITRWTGKHIDGHVATVKKLVARWEKVREKAFKNVQLYYLLPAALREQDAPHKVG